MKDIYTLSEVADYSGKGRRSCPGNMDFGKNQMKTMISSRLSEAAAWDWSKHGEISSGAAGGDRQDRKIMQSVNKCVILQICIILCSRYIILEISVKVTFRFFPRVKAGIVR